MAQLRDEEETKRLQAMQIPADAPEAEPRVPEQEPAATLFDEPEIEQQDYPGHVNELQDEPETDWAQIALASPQHAPTIPNITVGHEEIVLPSSDTIPDSPTLQDEIRAQTAQPSSAPLVKPDTSLPLNVTTPASPSISQRGSAQTVLYDDGDDYTLATTSPQSPPTSPASPRTPLSPNAQLPDSDPKKRWCVCRGVDDGERMVMCEEPWCRGKWFHFGCVGLEGSPGGRGWWCGMHRRGEGEEGE